MSILEYALDVNKTKEEIIKLCKGLGIQVTDEYYELNEDEIILLDNELQSTEVDEETELSEEEIDEDVLDEKVENIINEFNLGDIPSEKVTKIKPKTAVKDNTQDFLKAKKAIYKHRDKLLTNDEEEDENIILYKENITVGDLAVLLNVKETELIKKLFTLGVMANVNQSLNYETVELICLDYGKEVKKESVKDISNFEDYEIIDKEEDLEIRPAVVTIMGHVDHGKTSLLDTIRKTNVVDGEAGGITQAIDAYQVSYNQQKITFIDTPGHAAFTEMRARGASVTDIVIIIVAADDGIMPQTKEAIDHAKLANVPIIVAINKIDKPNANPDKILTELVETGLTPEAWGGDTLVCKISAKTGEGIDNLLDNILLIAEMQNLKANPLRYATGTVIEAKMDKQIGSIVTILIQNGTLRLGDPLVVGDSYGKVRTLKNDLNHNIASALPSTPVEITGLNELPMAGDKFMAFETEKQARSISEARKTRSREKDSNKSGMTLEDLFSHIQSGIKEINIILKTDLKGSQEAVKNSLEKIEIGDVRVKIIRSGVGTISESDVILANASNAVIIGFNVRPSAKTVEIAKEYGVEIKLYDIIYKVVEDLEKAMKGMLDPIFEEKVIGAAEVRKLFKFSKVGNIAGCHVINGIIKNNSDVRVIRDGIVIYTGKISSLQREKDNAKEVKNGLDCGITIDNFNDIKENDIFEAFEIVEIKV
ncbi:MAG: translation initiation factor IF-2 [Tenericutes bacterium]|nr:translation initiation factor IF-2 [Mycoplasmatota bacterium]